MRLEAVFEQTVWWTMPQPNMIVLYDGGCPMCSREILHYRRIAGDRPIDWIDVTQPEANLAPFGLNREEALRLFHVVDRSGAMQVGARAFMALWAELPGYRWLARVCRGLRLAPVLEWVYVRFAGWHFRRRCVEGSCDLGSEHR